MAKKSTFLKKSHPRDGPMSFAAKREKKKRNAANSRQTNTPHNRTKTISKNLRQTNTPHNPTKNISKNPLEVLKITKAFKIRAIIRKKMMIMITIVIETTVIIFIYTKMLFRYHAKSNIFEEL